MRLAALPLIASLWASASVAEVPKVVTDIPPVQSLVAQVMGDLGQPGVLVAGGADAHSYQLRPSQARALAGADLVFWVGPEMTPWLERALATNTAAKVVGLLAADGVRLRIFPDELGKAADGTQTGTNPDDHDHHGTDPHAWLDPANAAVWLDVIRDALVAADPDNAAIYARNDDQAQSGLLRLNDEISAQLAVGPQAPIVVGHNAYGYFAAHFGVTIAAAIEAGDASDPGAARLSAVAGLLKAQGVRCLFPEAGHDPKRAEILVEGTTTRIGAALDPEGRMVEPGPGLYAALLHNLAKAIAQCQSAD